MDCPVSQVRLGYYSRWLSVSPWKQLLDVVARKCMCITDKFENKNEPTLVSLTEKTQILEFRVQIRYVSLSFIYVFLPNVCREIG